MLEKTIQPLIVEETENQLDIDGGWKLNERSKRAPSHCIAIVSQFLNDTFQINGLGGDVQWNGR